MSRIIKPQFGRQLRYGHPLAQGLVGFWSFKEGCGNRVGDLSGNGNTGITSGMTGTPTSGWNPGKFGPALAFDGTNDYVDVGQGASLDTAAITISAWINTGDSETFARIVTDLDEPNLSFLLGKDPVVANKIRFLVKNAAHATQTAFGTVLAIGVDRHVVGTYDGSNVKLYEDSVLKDSQALAGDKHALEGNVIIGADNNPIPADCYAGLINVVHIYNRALTAAKVQWLYQDPFAMFDQRRIWAVAAVGHVPHFLVIKRRVA